jgi:hypothetical protein
MWSRREFLTRGTVAALSLAGYTGAAAPVKSFITPDSQKAIDRGLEYLADKQGANGSWGTGSFRENVAVTSLAALALMAGGYQPGRGKYGDKIKSALGFVLDVGEANGGGKGVVAYPAGFLFNSKAAAQQGPMYNHGFGTLFLADVFGMVPDEKLRPRVRNALRMAVNIILAAQSKEGGWRYLPTPREADLTVTTCQITALRAANRAGIVGDQKDPNNPTRPSLKVARDRCLEYVKKCQNDDGSFVYMAGLPRIATVGNDRSFARSAAGVASLYAAGLSRGSEIDKGLRFLKENRRTHPGGRADLHYFYGHYYAVQCMKTAGGDHWTDWFPLIRDELIEHQTKEGYWEDALCSHYGTAMACFILQVPRNYVNSLSQ